MGRQRPAPLCRCRGRAHAAAGPGSRARGAAARSVGALPPPHRRHRGSPRLHAGRAAALADGRLGRRAEVREEGADVRAVTVWSMFGTVDWNTLLTQRQRHLRARHLRRARPSASPHGHPRQGFGGRSRRPASSTIRCSTGRAGGDARRASTRMPHGPAARGPLGAPRRLLDHRRRGNTWPGFLAGLRHPRARPRPDLARRSRHSRPRRRRSGAASPCGPGPWSIRPAMSGSRGPKAISICCLARKCRRSRRSLAGPAPHAAYRSLSSRPTLSSMVAARRPISRAIRSTRLAYTGARRRRPSGA